MFQTNHLYLQSKHKQMETWMLEKIKETFNRCYGLQSSIIKDTKGALEELAYQTSFRLDYLKEHLEEIKNLVV